MLRNRAVALILCWLASPLAFSLGLGPLEATSGLNEPFKGRIEILGAKAEDFDSLTVGLAGEAQFERAGIDRHPALFQLRFTLDDKSPGKDYITISSRDPIREPFLNFLLEMNWPNGRLMREYTVLLDPPLYDPQRRAPAPVAAAPSAAPAALPYTPSAGAPAAPSAPAYAPAPSAAPAAAPRFAAGQEIGPVQANDTLWSLAMAHRPDESVSVQQMMLALLRANPDAFSEGNINMLRRGAVMRLPDAETLNAISANEAYAEVRRQHQVWEEYRQQIGSAPTPQPMGAAPAPDASSPAAATPAATAAADARLELVAPGGSEGGGTPGGTAEAGSGDSALAQEAIDTQTQAAADLESKLKEAEEIIDLLQRQVNIKDAELSALQARLRELGVDTGTAPAAETEAPAADATTTADAAAPTAEEAAPDVAATPDAAAEPPVDATAPETPAEDAVIAEDAAPAEDTVVDQATTDETIIEEDTAAAPAESAPAPAAADEEQDIVVETPAAPPAPAAGFPANLVPPALADLIPGGPLAVLGIAALLVLGLFAAVAQFLIRSRNRDATPLANVHAGAPAGTEDITQATPTTTSVPDDSEAITQFGIDAATEVPGFDPNATVEATASESPTEIRGDEPQSDPLEEVNVYLAYERFDQAEELVKRVIAQYPHRHDYKLRLLEVYYSSNDRSAYEAAARELFDAVGESDPLWGSAVAMWSEMSPERALFAEGAVPDAAPAPDAAKTFVDITADVDDAPGESTVAHAPGGHDSDLDGGLDFNLGDATEGGGDVLDLTAAADGNDIFDLTAVTGDSDDGGVLDITAGEVDADSGVLDISGGGDTTLAEDDGGILDLTAGDSEVLDLSGGEDILDITGLENQMAAVGGSDLLDVTKTGDISSFEDHDLLNVTSPGLRGAEPLSVGLDEALGGVDTAELSIADSEPGGSTGLDFDISDTVAPAFGADSDVDDDDVLDITSGPKTGDEDALDFDIGGLDSGLEVAAPAISPDDAETVELHPSAAGAAPGGLDLDLGVGDADGGNELDFDITMGAEDLAAGLGLGDSENAGDGLDLDLGLGLGEEAGGVGELSLQGSELDDLALDAELPAGGDDDFDFSLEGTTEMDSIATDETIDMASVVASNRELVDNGDDASLDELTVELDSALGTTGLDTVELDLGDEDLLTTMSLDVEDDGPDSIENTVVLPRSEIDMGGDDDEADTKLNLAKAYIELGDTEGARSILDEVVADGNVQQKAEARALLGQLGA